MSNPYAIGCKTTGTKTTCQFSDTLISNPKGTLIAQTEAVDGKGYIVLDMPLRAVTSQKKADPAELFTGNIESTFVEVLYKKPYLSVIREVLMFKSGFDYVSWLQERPTEAPDGLKETQRSKNIKAITYHEISSTPIQLPVSSIQFDSYEIAESLLEAPEAFIVISASGTVLHQTTSAPELAAYASKSATPEAMILIHLQNDNPAHTLVNGETLALGFSSKSTLKAYAEHVISQNQVNKPKTSLIIRQEAGRLFAGSFSIEGIVRRFTFLESDQYQIAKIKERGGPFMEQALATRKDNLQNYDPDLFGGIRLKGAFYFIPNWDYLYAGPVLSLLGNEDMFMFEAGLEIGGRIPIFNWLSAQPKIDLGYHRTTGNMSFAQALIADKKMTFSGFQFGGGIDLAGPTMWEWGALHIKPVVGFEYSGAWGEMDRVGAGGLTSQSMSGWTFTFGLQSFIPSKKTDPQYIYTSDPEYIGGEQRVIHKPIQTQTWTETVEEPAAIIVREVPAFSVVNSAMFNIESEFTGGDQFESGSPYLSTSGMAAVEKVAQGMLGQIKLAKTLGLIQYQIEGNISAYADLAGSGQYNMVLSKLRAGLAKTELTSEEQALADKPLAKGTGTYGFKLNLIERLEALITGISESNISITAAGLGETRPYAIKLSKKPGSKISITPELLAKEQVLELDSNTDLRATSYYYVKDGETYRRTSSYKKAQDNGYALIKVDGDYYLLNLPKTRRVVADVKVRFTDLEVNYATAATPTISPIEVSEGLSSAKIYNYNFTDSAIPPKADKTAIAMLLHKKVSVDPNQQLIVAIHLPQNTSAADQRTLENYLMLMANQHTDQPARFITIKDSAYTEPSMSIITGSLHPDIFTSGDSESMNEGSVGYKIRQAMDGFAKQ